MRVTRKQTNIMSENLLELPLNADGAVSRWLAVGPLLSPLRGVGDVVEATGSPFGAGRRWVLSYWAFHPASLALKSRIYALLPPPVLGAWGSDAPGVGAPGPGAQVWRYATVEEDQLVDFSHFNFAPHRMEGWLYTGLVCDETLTLDAELITIGPARVWLDGKELIHPEAFSYVAPMVVPLRMSLTAGWHEVFIHGDMIGWREARLALGLRFAGHAPVRTSIALGNQRSEEWQRAETGLAHLQITQFAVPGVRGEIRLAASAPAPVSVDLDARLAKTIFMPKGTPAQAMPGEHARHTLQPGESAPLPLSEHMAAEADHVIEGNVVALTIGAAEGPPITLERHLWINSTPYSEQAYGSYDERRQEALNHLALNRQHVMGWLAAVEVGQAQTIDSDAIGLSCNYLEQRFDCADFYALSLLTLLYRFSDRDVLQSADRARVERAFQHFKFWMDEPGLDGMCYITENHQILFHVTAYLTGQYWPDRVFSNSGFSGRQQMQRARPRIETWVLRRLQGGFSEWDSNTYLAMDVFAMLALVEFATSQRLREMATALLDKILFMIAVQSFRGAHGSSHGRCYAEGLKTARADATSGLQRIAWGTGTFNGEVYATGMLALAHRYRVPDALQAIGADLPDVLVTRAHSRGRYRPQFDIQRGEWNVRTITRRTPHTMLAAAIDHRPGQMGIQEHLWQATLGPDAVVFTTYPGNNQEHGNARPNFWAGSVRLPRVGMYDRTLVALYRVESGVGLGFTHAYFPSAAFDDCRIEGQWAFARRGKGYVALWSDGDLRLTELGRHAGQELRSAAGGSAWVCTVGSAAEDGDWATFCARARQQSPVFESGMVHWGSLTGARLRFGWHGPLQVDGKPEDWAHFPHYENAYTCVAQGADTMEIRINDRALTLDLQRGRVLDR